MRQFSTKRRNPPVAIDFLPNGHLLAAFKVGRTYIEIENFDTGETVQFEKHHLNHFPLAYLFHEPECRFVGNLTLWFEELKCGYSLRHYLGRVVGSSDAFTQCCEEARRVANSDNDPFRFTTISVQSTGFGYYARVEIREDPENYSLEEEGHNYPAPNTYHYICPYEWTPNSIYGNRKIDMRLLYDDRNKIYYRNMMFGRDIEVHANVWSPGNDYDWMDLYVPGGAYHEIYARDTGVWPLGIATIPGHSLVLSPVRPGGRLPYRISTGKYVYYIDNHSGSVVKCMEMPHGVVSGLIASSPDGILYAVAGRKVITVWDAD